MQERKQSASPYTCPMHPEIRADQPGACPKCGMALEPVSPRLAAKAQWTCPMHPEIVRNAPGTCPICGMALEARAPTAGVENAELRDMTRRFWLAGAMSVPVVLLAMLPGRFWTPLLSERAVAAAQFVLATPVVIWAGWPFFVRGYRSI